MSWVVMVAIEGDCDAFMTFGCHNFSGMFYTYHAIMAVGLLLFFNSTIPYP